jgi:hypothetical protein
MWIALLGGRTRAFLAKVKTVMVVAGGQHKCQSADKLVPNSEERIQRQK